MQSGFVLTASSTRFESTIRRLLSRFKNFRSCIDIFKRKELSLTELYSVLSLGIGLIGVGLSILSSLSWYFEELFLFRSLPAFAYLLSGATLCTASELIPRQLAVFKLPLSALLFLCLPIKLALQSGFFERIDFFGLALLPGMQLFDAVGFGLLALSLASLDLPLRKFLKCSEIPCILALLLSQMALIGLLFNVPDFCLIISCLKVSPLNVLALLLAAIGVLLCRPATGLMSIMASPNAGGKLARRLLPSVALLPLLLGTIKFLGESFRIFDSESGLTVIVLMMIVLLFALLISNSIWLEESEAKRIAALEELEASEQRLAAIINQANDAFIVVDRDGRIRHWNRRCTDIFGKEAGTVSGEVIWDFLQTGGEKALPDILRCQRNDSNEVQSAVKPLETVLKCRDGNTEFPAELSPFTVRLNDDTMYCAFIRDITERKAIEANFRDFYFTVSHELRAPLTAVRGSLQLLTEDRETILSPDALRLVSTAEASCLRLIKLISDLLDVKRVESGKFAINKVEVDPLMLISSSIDNINGAAKLKNIVIDTIINEAPLLRADSDRLVQVVTNLLSNAVKFSPDKSQILVLSEITKNKNLRISVMDEGPGVPPSMRPSLFQKFQQLPMTSFKQLGSGLGLSISKTIVEEHGGRIGIESRSDSSGSVFWFEIPV